MVGNWIVKDKADYHRVYHAGRKHTNYYRQKGPKK